MFTGVLYSKNNSEQASKPLKIEKASESNKTLEQKPFQRRV
jgi:hypothetical protein